VTPVARSLLAWFSQGHRDLPWRRTTDPYRIWVSEIMLQQTRSETAIPYYERFLDRFPTVAALAAASEDEVLQLWSGLGYYSRARLLRRAAMEIAAAGAFPTGYAGLRALPGIGDYTAAAVASIAFDLPHAVLDGNVLRVVARMENDAADIAAPRTRERFRAVAQQWLDARHPGAFNQALMELGATVCLPRRPLCPECPLASLCQARAAGTVAQLPVKLRRLEPEHIDATVYVIRSRNRVLLRRRPDEARRMAGFWELPGPSDLPEMTPGPLLGTFRHTITRHHYHVAVHLAHAPRGWELPAGFQWFSAAALAAVPVDTMARKALRFTPSAKKPVEKL
jgi:A/G-specific adenine glycosylase